MRVYIATNASLFWPEGVAVDASGNIFIADTSNNRIRKVSTNGIITTIAGNGATSGTIGVYSGDGGPATSAGLNSPTGVAVDALGNLFIADAANLRIRKVSSDGIITTVAGNGTEPYSGDGGPATNAGLSYPSGVAVDASSNLYIADYGNARIRKVSINGFITTVAGNGAFGYSGDGGAAASASLYGPYHVAVDAYGNLFIADGSEARVRKVSTNSIITNVAGDAAGGFSGDGGSATNASLDGPFGVAVDAAGNVFIADWFNIRIRKVDTNGIIATVAGTGPVGYGTGSFSGDGDAATNASLNMPYDVAVDVFGNLFIADSGNSRIRKVTSTQGASLGLNEVTAGNTGNYEVVVTGSGGSVTSNVAKLIVASSPLIYDTVPSLNGSLVLHFVSQPNSTNVVFCASDLTPPVLWQPLSTNVAFGDGDWQFTETNTANHRARFYRSATH